MSTTEKLHAVMNREPQDAAGTFPAMLLKFKDEIARALPKHLNGDRMARIALTAFRRTPKLAECDPRSVFAAVIQASQLGLEPDTMGRAYLIPYGKECQFIPGWKGLVDLVNRTGQASVWTGAVFRGDEFEYAQGDRPHIIHRPCGEDDVKALTHVYAVGRVKGAEWPVIEVWTMDKVIRHRDRYNKVGKRHYSFEHLEMYARKVVLLQVVKYMPASADMALAIGLDQAATAGQQQHLTVQSAIEGSWVPVPDEGDLPRTNETEKNTLHQQEQTAAVKETAGKVPAESGPQENPRLLILTDALAFALSGNEEDARSLAASLTDEEQQQVYAAIAKAKKKVKGGDKNISIE